MINNSTPLATCNNFIASEVSFANENSATSELKPDSAAREIKFFFRKITAAKAYKHMFDNGVYFKQYGEIPPNTKLFNYLKIAQKLSTKAITEIMDDLGDLIQE